jgi:Holliday junction resolvase
MFKGFSMSKKYASKVDANQKEIIQAFRQMGCSVAPTHNAGKGFPDLVVGFQGVNFMVEIKDGNKPPSAQKLTPDQIKFHDEWRGQICIVNCVDDCVDLLNNVHLKQGTKP